MFEEIFGKAAWPIAVIIAVLCLSIAWYNINKDNQDMKLKVACVQSGGTLGEHNGWPTCTPAKIP